MSVPGVLKRLETLDECGKAYRVISGPNYHYMKLSPAVKGLFWQ